MPIKLIACLDSANGIGLSNSIPWHLPMDLKRFKRLTMDQRVIMGRKTFESIGKPLPGRINHVVSTKQELPYKGIIHSRSLDGALHLANQDAWIIGGQQIYCKAINLADELYITKINKNFNCDTFFPEIDLSVWQLKSVEIGYSEEVKACYRYFNYERKR
jgi:dihydrofolate reductase